MNQKKGSTFGAILLIGASCIGAGMLGLPIQTGITGFFPSIIMFIIIWAFMTLTGLLIAEASSWYKTGANFLTIAENTIGSKGKIACSVFYLFLFYALLVAFISASGHLFSSILKQNFNLLIAPYMGSFFFVLLFGYLVFLGTRSVDICNRMLMFLKISSFLILVLLGVGYIQPKFFNYSDISKIPASLPILITAFGYQNLVPTLNSYLNGDTKRVKKAVVGGSLLSLAVYLIWQTIVIGIIPQQGVDGLQESLKLGKEATEVMSHIMQSTVIGPLAQLFGFFAVLTSFLAQSLSLSHFLSEGFKISYKKHENLAMCALTLIPPLALSLIYPDLFFKALNFAGGFCIAILFGIIPTFVIWKGRYKLKNKTTHQVFGGKALLLAVFTFSSYIFLFELYSMFSSI